MLKFKRQRTQGLTRTQREDGKQDAWNGHVQVASQATAVPEEYGPDAERQEVKRDEQEFRKAQQQVKKTTQARARRERSVIINEYESDKITSNEAILTATDVELAESPGPQRSDRTVRRSSVEAPLLVVSSLVGRGAVDDTAVAFLIKMALKRKEEEQEKEKAAKVEEELVVLVHTPANQLTLPQRLRLVGHFRTGPAQAWLAAALPQTKKKKKRRTRR